MTVLTSIIIIFSDRFVAPSKKIEKKPHIANTLPGISIKKILSPKNNGDHSTILKDLLSSAGISLEFIIASFAILPARILL